MSRPSSPLRAAEQRLTLWASTQVPHKVKRYVGQLLHQPPREVRVIAPDVGGGFGQKVEIWPEDIALSYLAMRLAQPIKWIEERWENMLATMVVAIARRWKPRQARWDDSRYALPHHR